MKKFFEKHEMLITMLLIIIYIISNSYCMQNFGFEDYRTTIVNLVLSLAIIIFIIKSKLGEYYGLTKVPRFKKFLYFIPLVIIMSVNLWSGININNSPTEIIFYILSMIGVGFLEEIIFRIPLTIPILIAINTAIIVTSLTFGIGHIVNLLNGADLVPTLIQICYAVAIGYLFVIIFQKGKSLWPCIITHSVVNALSIFNVESFVSSYIAPIFLIVIPIWYAIYVKNIELE